MHEDNLTGKKQANTITFFFGCKEGDENLILNLLSYGLTVIHNPNGAIPVFGLSDKNLDILFLIHTGGLHRIPDQIQHDLIEQDLIRQNLAHSLIDSNAQKGIVLRNKF